MRYKKKKKTFTKYCRTLFVTLQTREITAQYVSKTSTMADSPARETPEEIIRILRCSDEDFANILDKNNVIILTCGWPKY